MICEFCRSTVLESEKRWDYHHRHAASFEASLQSRCVFCTRLAENLGNLSPWFDNEHEIKSVYRWNIRQAYRTRDTQSYISIRFRPIPGRGDGNKRSETLPDVQFHLYPKDDFNSDIDISNLGAGTNSKQSQEQMRAWMDDCVNNHPECIRHHSSRNFVPTRVLDVGPPEDTTWPPSYVRVVDTKKTPINAPYLTLSHCWGDGVFVQLTKENLGDFIVRGVPWEGKGGICSNTTFAQALQVVRQLGMRYIWIDCLCIIQGIGDKGVHVEDWKAEAPLMHKVYRNSFCNIAAADSRNHTEGLFRPRKPNFLPVWYTSRKSSKIFGETAWRVLEYDHWDRGLLKRHLYTRGWVFQERLLSPRLLHFGAGQVFWDCAAISASEALTDGLPPALDTVASTHRSWRRQLQGSALSVGSLVSSTADSLQGFWTDSVRAYTSCNLTFHNDKLAAMWGIAKLVRDALGEEYGAGLWTNGLHEQLAWRVLEWGAEKTDCGKEGGFPSWSWASVKGAVEVAPPVPDLPRFYTALGHDGKALRFLLKNPLFGRFEGEHSASWKEELVNMTRRLEETSVKISRKAAAKVANVFASIPEEPPETKNHKDLENFPDLDGKKHLTSKGFGIKDSTEGPAKNDTGLKEDEPEKTEPMKTDSGNKDAAEKRHAADMPSELLSNKIAIQTHICKGTLQQAPEEGEWTVAIEDLNQSDAFIKAFPDTRPHRDSTRCEFLLLAVSKEVCDDLGEWGPDDGYLEDEDIGGTHYSGSAILVEKVEDNHFRRIGAMMFCQLDEDSWRHLRRAGGQNEEIMEGELDVEDGQRVWLV
ncbi:heterokaryon incompatibility protein [Colletotrichum incanum]|uniref:Heterokaryon incompatibility protein n=1 Tax=Colletotrichum incanum TaxID=1573173 RepID=A0A162N5M8_COLIC|nr:heterokaryon incompatibility protein [Colletotrichum incanum]